MKLAEKGITRFFNKTCSVFRGNIGQAFDAMLDALNEEFAAVVLGYPNNGRTTVNSIHYVNQVILEKTDFRNDPMNPMTESNLVEILAKQTSRKVGAIHADAISQGVAVLKYKLQTLKSVYNYVIFDVRDNHDLSLIGEALQNEKVICGAAAIGFHLGHALRKPVHTPIKAPVLVPKKGIISIAGSLTPQTILQTKYAADHGVYTMEMNTVALVQGHQDHLIQAIASEATEKINEGQHVLIYSSQDPKSVATTKSAGAAAGYSEFEIAKIVSTTLAKISKRVIEQTGQNRVLVAGGDTSASFCDEMNLHGMTVYQEIAPGVPSCITMNDPKLLLVLKSGSFGPASFFMDAYSHLLQF